MSANSKIQWTDATWSPIRARVKDDAPQIAMLHGWKDLAEICEKMKGHVGPHCEFVSSGCNHCYSCTNNHRCLPSNGTGLPFDKRSRELVDIFLDEKILMQPLKWRTPKKVFVENQSDLFGEWVPDGLIDKVFAVMALSPQHTFQILTKRPERMRKYMSDREVPDRVRAVIYDTFKTSFTQRQWSRTAWFDPAWKWPMSHIWLGVSCEDQKTADERIPLLLQTPSAVHFVSYEPALAAVDFTQIKCPGAGFMDSLSGRNGDGLGWVIAGGESGPGARPFNLNWARNVIRQCEAANVPVFCKQLGRNPYTEFDAHTIAVHLKDGHGGDMSEWPEDLRIRQWPESDRDNRN